jgi:hypothetical protein
MSFTHYTWIKPIFIKYLGTLSRPTYGFNELADRLRMSKLGIINGKFTQSTDYGINGTGNEQAESRTKGCDWLSGRSLPSTQETQFDPHPWHREQEGGLQSRMINAVIQCSIMGYDEWRLPSQKPKVQDKSWNSSGLFCTAGILLF